MFNTDRRDMFSETIKESDEHSLINDKHAPVQDNDEGSEVKTSLNLAGMFVNAMKSNIDHATDCCKSDMASQKLIS